MNSMLEKCGSLAVLVSLWTILPVPASATKRSIANTLRVDMNAIHLPSGLIDGPTFSSLKSDALITIRPISFGGVAQPHRGVRIDRSELQIFRHPFDEPQRQASGADLAWISTRRRGDVELERVDELVADDVIRVGQRTGERQHDAAPDRLGDAAG